MEKELVIVKSSGEKMIFSTEKLEKSLLRSGTSKAIADSIVEQVSSEVYEGISTKEIYNRAYVLLRKKRPVLASRYKLKKAIYELGPTGFPFEKFIAAIMQFSGFNTQTNTIVEGNCVDHEIDVIALKNNLQIFIECKFHGEEGRKCDVKVPLYINSRFNDIKKKKSHNNLVDEGWVATNTRFTKDALNYGNCTGLYLLSWDYPKGDSLKERIDRLGLYPITVSTIMSKREKQFLLSRDVVLCRQLINDSFYLDHLGVSEERKQKILTQINELCNFSK